MLVNTKEILNKANNSNYAIPSPDFINLNMLKTYIKVAEELNKPAILAISETLSEDFSIEEVAVVAKYYIQKSNVPIALHLDHGKTVDFVKKAIDLGFTSVMIDGSNDSFEENVKKTKEIVEYAKARNVCVEAEIGHVGSGVNYEDESGDSSIYTTVEELKEFVKETGVDSIAVSIGTAHGVYKGFPKIDFERLKELKDSVDIPLVLHGGSSSGDLNLKKCAEIGISKINIFTDICIAGADGINKLNSRNYREMMFVADEAMGKMLEHYYKVFNCI